MFKEFGFKKIVGFSIFLTNAFAYNANASEDFRILTSLDKIKVESSTGNGIITLLNNNSHVHSISINSNSGQKYIYTARSISNPKLLDEIVRLIDSDVNNNEVLTEVDIIFSCSVAPRASASSIFIDSNNCTLQRFLVAPIGSTVGLGRTSVSQQYFNFVGSELSPIYLGGVEFMQFDDDKSQNITISKGGNGLIYVLKASALDGVSSKILGPSLSNNYWSPVRNRLLTMNASGIKSFKGNLSIQCERKIVYNSTRVVELPMGICKIVNFSIRK